MSHSLFEEKKLQFGCFSYRKTPKLQFFLLKKRMSFVAKPELMNFSQKTQQFGRLTESNAQIVVFFD